MLQNGFLAGLAATISWAVLFWAVEGSGDCSLAAQARALTLSWCAEVAVMAGLDVVNGY